MSAVAAVGSASASTPAPKARPTLLIVDDEAELRDVLAQVLAREFDVATAASTSEAEMLLGLRAFDLMICDQLMPGETGLDFFVRNYGRWPAMKRILLTGYMNPELISRSVTVAGLAACVLKPVTPTELKQVVRAALAG